MNGITTSWSRIGTKLSASVVMMCTQVKAQASTDALRCSPAVTNRGQPRLAYRTEASRPSAMLAVSSTRATSPVARVMYQSGVLEFTTIATAGAAALELIMCPERVVLIVRVRVEVRVQGPGRVRAARRP